MNHGTVGQVVDVGGRGVPARGRRRSLGRRRRLVGAAMVAPAFAVVAVFFFAPLALMAWMSLHDWPLLGHRTWVGLRNYLDAFTDSDFLAAVRFTFLYTVLITPVLFLVGLALALLVRTGRRGAAFFQTVYFVPVVIGLASASYLWIWLVQPNLGPLPAIASRLGLSPPGSNWLAGAGAALVTVTVMVVWKVAGMQMILLLSGLQSIPTEIGEAARVDGASRWQTLLRITLPLMRPSIALTLVYSVAGSLLAFDQFFVMTKGGPANTTITAVFHIYRTSFIDFRLGYGAALSVLLLVVLALVSAVQLMLLRDGDKN